MATWPCESCERSGIIPTCPRCGIGTKSRNSHLAKRLGIKKKKSGGARVPRTPPRPITETKRVIQE